MQQQTTVEIGQSRFTTAELFRFIRRILAGERQYYGLAIIYGVGISLLTLAVPISVQMLINTVANTALATPLVILTATLFVLLLISGLLNALRIHLMELFGRRFYARLVSEITLRTLYAQNPFFTDQGKGTLFNRYFDIVIVQKMVPYLLIGGFTVILQALVGFAIVSAYHPVFLGFNIALVFLLWLVWVIWGRAAMHSAVELSHTKHNVAGWIEGLGASNGYYKSRKHIERALIESDQKTAEYIDSSIRHFKYTFAQTIAFLFIYALASASLLGLGGWLVIVGQLSLGQLVAAELILSAVFYGISQFGVYCVSFYDLTAAVEELSHFFRVSQEFPSGDRELRKGPYDLKFVNAGGVARGEKVLFDFTLEAGDQMMCAAPNAAVQRLFSDFLKHHAKPDGGIVSFAGTDVLDIEVHELRQIVTILDRPTLIEGKIRDYLKATESEASAYSMLDALTITGLTPTIEALSESLDTQLSITGAPLSLVEVLKLKLAGALLSGPNVLVINQLYDMIPGDILKDVLRAFREAYNTTIFYFSNRTRTLGFEKFMMMHAQEQVFISDQEAFNELRHNATRATVYQSAIDSERSIENAIS